MVRVRYSRIFIPLKKLRNDGGFFRLQLNSGIKRFEVQRVWDRASLRSDHLARFVVSSPCLRCNQLTGPRQR
jgi:hypothetical protein